MKIKYIIPSLALLFGLLAPLPLIGRPTIISETPNREADRILSLYVASLEHENKASLPDQLSYEPLTGGHSGASNFRVYAGSHTYVLRLFQPVTGEIDRIRQMTNAKLAGELGISPKVLFVDPQLQGYLMAFIPGRTARHSDFTSKKNLAQFAELLWRLHHADEAFPQARSPFESFQLFVSKGEQASVAYPSQFEEVKKRMKEIQGTLALHPVPLAPSHLDLSSQNIMVDKGRFQLIDWENGGLSDPYFDLAMFSLFLRLDDAQSKQFLTDYFHRPPTQEEWDRFIITRPVSLLLGAATFLYEPGGKRTTRFYDKRLAEQPPPKIEELVRLYEEGKLDLPRWEIGLGLMQGGLDLVDSPDYQASLKRLQSSAAAKVFS